MKKKRILLLAFLSVIFTIFSAPVLAEEGENSEDTYEAYYDEQLRESGAEDLPDELPEEARDSLGSLGVEGLDWESISSITPETLFSTLGSMADEASGRPIHVLTMILAVILISAMANGMRLSLQGPASSAASLTSVLCICAVLIQPAVEFIHQAEVVIEGAAGFLLACIPVLGGIMLASGQPAASASFQLLTTAGGNGVMLVCAGILVPLMNIFLGISIVSAVSPDVKLDGLCTAFTKVIKWILGFCMTVFSGLLAVHGIVTSAVDSTAGRAARFMVSSFVPIVGGALGEALGTVTSCVKTLKSGVTAFAVLAECVIFLPVVLQCLLWQLTVTVCAGVSRMFGLSDITILLDAVGKVMETIQAILLCSMAILTITMTVMLMLGGVSA